MATILKLKVAIIIEKVSLERCIGHYSTNSSAFMLPDIKTNILVDLWVLHGVNNINSSLVVNSWTK